MDLRQRRLGEAKEDVSDSGDIVQKLSVVPSSLRERAPPIERGALY